MGAGTAVTTRMKRLTYTLPTPCRLFKYRVFNDKITSNAVQWLRIRRPLSAQDLRCWPFLKTRRRPFPERESTVSRAREVVDRSIAVASCLLQMSNYESRTVCGQRSACKMAECLLAEAAAFSSRCEAVTLSQDEKTWARARSHVYA